MKAFFLIAGLLLSSFSFANETRSEEAYECIAQRLQAINSDIWCNLTPADIDDLLQNGGPGYQTVVNVAAACDADANSR